jgi:phosphotransferase system enzyme I (PtsP)
MTADPLAAALLLGLGFKALSVNLGSYARIRQAIGSMKLAELRRIAEKCLKMSRPWEVESELRGRIYLGPDLTS